MRPAGGAPPALTRDEITRYSRHLLLPEIAAEGQQALKAARVVVVGAGGLGSPNALYLAAAGVGTLGLVDADSVDVTNLQRQVLYSTSDVGRLKVEAAAARLRAMNPCIDVVAHQEPLTAANAIDLIGGYDLVVDGTDNFPARYLINDACVILGRPFVYGSVHRFEGQVSVFAAIGGPCYRCLYPEPPEPGAVPSCAEAGILGVVPGIVGTIQAAEAIKIVIGMPETLVGRVLVVDAARMRFRDVRLKRDAQCPACGAAPGDRRLIDYADFCGVPAVPPGGVEGATSPAAEAEITARALADRIASGDPPLLVDLRGPLERAINGLPGAVAIPAADLAAGGVELPRDRDLVVFCRVGERSERVVKALRGAGYARAFTLRGGVLAWIAEVDPSMPRY